MSVKGAILTVVALSLGGLLLFSRSGGGMFLGLSIIMIASGAVVTALHSRDSDASGDATAGKR